MRSGLTITRNGAALWNGDRVGWVARDDFDFWCFKASPAYGLEDVSAPLRRRLAALITSQCIAKLITQGEVMTDIVYRLRSDSWRHDVTPDGRDYTYTATPSALEKEAADEIERLRAALREIADAYGEPEDDENAAWMRDTAQRALGRK